MRHLYQKVTAISTFFLTAAGGYLGYQGLIFSNEDGVEGAAIGSALGFGAGMALYGLAKVGINAIEKCLDCCGSERAERMKLLAQENQQLKSSLRLWGKSGASINDSRLNTTTGRVRSSSQYESLSVLMAREKEQNEEQSAVEADSLPENRSIEFGVS